MAAPAAKAAPPRRTQAYHSAGDGDGGARKQGQTPLLSLPPDFPRGQRDCGGGSRWLRAARSRQCFRAQDRALRVPLPCSHGAPASPPSARVGSPQKTPWSRRSHSKSSGDELKLARSQCRRRDTAKIRKIKISFCGSLLYCALFRTVYTFSVFTHL